MLNLAGCAQGNSQNPENPVSLELQILFINVGKADSALVSFGEKHFLVDTGSSESLPRLVRALRDRGVEKLEGIFLSHTHEDHTGGLEGILKMFDTGNIYASEITTNKKDGTNVVDTIAQEAGKTVKRLKQNDEIALDPGYPGVKFFVLGPVEFNADDDNDNSLVLYLQCKPFSCLFTGDMQFAEEKSLLRVNALKPGAVLKVGNHGNPDASSHEFISRIAPEYAVISTDSAIDTDTPAPSVVEVLKSVQARVYVTQDAKTGIMAKTSGGKTSVEEYTAKAVPAAAEIKIESLDKDEEFLTLRNTGSTDADLSKGWIFSEQGGEMFFFPDGTVMKANGILTISSGKDPKDADLKWDDKNVWHNKKTDTAAVYDSMGNELCRLEK